MKNIKLLIVTLIMITLCGCGVQSKTTTLPDYPIIDAPDKAQRESIDGYLIKDNEKNDNTNDDVAIYYANIKTHKFHRPDCIYAKRLSDVNARLEKDKEVLLLDGYSPCGKCNP